MSTILHWLTGTAPPSSNADIEPTIAKSWVHAFAVAVRLDVESVLESCASSSSRRPQMPVGCVALKYVTNARAACSDDSKRPGTGPLTSATVPTRMVVAVTPRSVLPPLFVDVAAHSGPRG